MQELMQNYKEQFQSLDKEELGSKFQRMNSALLEVVEPHEEVLKMKYDFHKSDFAFEDEYFQSLCALFYEYANVIFKGFDELVARESDWKKFTDMQRRQYLDIFAFNCLIIHLIEFIKEGWKLTEADFRYFYKEVYRLKNPNFFKAIEDMIGMSWFELNKLTPNSPVELWIKSKEQGVYQC
ncbi:hypothetical protein CQA38_08235 [Campylobacter sp. MIT 12-5580]|uniref:hypothetical protein n=1 Tax=Campylobacter sp. MIT 12-5580 TaxID=2040651 RepID=UPI0010F8D7AE|nr:hypothetical protein [Campylobacter sp. MIT 12-5580]TKX28348.1 hypothetical protein CQA38_08235 [Campylobacter sp. MIT 12-5580]